MDLTIWELAPEWSASTARHSGHPPDSSARAGSSRKSFMPSLRRDPRIPLEAGLAATDEWYLGLHEWKAH